VSDLGQPVRRHRRIGVISDVSLLQFQQVSCEEVAAAIRALPDKSCALDPLPFTPIKAVADVAELHS